MSIEKTIKRVINLRINNFQRVMLQLQIILQHFYKLLMCQILISSVGLRAQNHALGLGLCLRTLGDPRRNK